MQNAKTIADELGRAEIAERLGIGLTAVSAAVVSGRFPSSWYKVITELAAAKQISVPDNMFRWKDALREAS